jgi:hypothetical protein
LAKQYEINRDTVINHAKRAGLSRKRPRLSPAESLWAIDAYREGLALLPIAKKLGVSANTVRLSLTTAGVEIRPRRGWRPA